MIEQITRRELAEMLPALDAGMVPKMAACLRAVEGGVAERAPSSTAGCRTRCCWRSSPTRDRDDGRAGVDRPGEQRPRPGCPLVRPP